MSDIVLDAYAARTCAVKTHHQFTPGATPGPLPEGLQDAFHGGSDHAAAVAAELARGTTDVVDLRGLAGDRSAACAAAMERGASVILGGDLPVDRAGHRSGRANVLLRAGSDAGRATYHPVLVKPRRMQEPRSSGRERQWSVGVSRLSAPAWADHVEVPDRAWRRRDHDLIQLAHLYRMVQACGRAEPGTPRAGIIGTDELSGEVGPVITWVDLAEPFLVTFSRTAESGRSHRSPLERHDHEHQFRVAVAERALAGGAPLVEPIRMQECEWCPWWSTCAPVLGEDDISVRIDTAPLDVREIRALRALGIRTIDDLADQDLDAVLPQYLPEVTHRDRAEVRLRNTVRRARMIRDGVTLERSTSGPIPVRRAALEIDFDLETYNDRPYLWGFWVHDRARPGEPYYREFTSWDVLDEAAEVDLAERALTWLRDITAGRDALVYHYSPYETKHLTRLAGRSDREAITWANTWSQQGFIDLYVPVRQHFFGCHGLGLKVVAHEGAGFHWRDPEPGGLNSLEWYEEAIGAESDELREAARRRLWAYNEDDVRATWALRAWLASLG